MMKRSEILSQGPRVRHDSIKADIRGDCAKAQWYDLHSIDRFKDIERERAEIRRIVRRYNRRFRRMSGQSLKGC
jgi:hypothetical protein